MTVINVIYLNDDLQSATYYPPTHNNDIPGGATITISCSFRFL